MLVDATTVALDPQMQMILSCIGNGGDPNPKRIGRGLYEMNHFSLDALLPGCHNSLRPGPWQEYPDLPAGGGCYGVCDSPEQFLAHPLGKALAASEREFCISFARVDKASQSADGGWRWHKWGEYIGEQDAPTTEYLYDEPNVDAVYCYHVFERIQDRHKPDCGTCEFNGRCSAQMHHPHDAGPDQPYCDGYVALGQQPRECYDSPKEKSHEPSG